MIPKSRTILKLLPTLRMSAVHKVFLTAAADLQFLSFYDHRVILNLCNMCQTYQTPVATFCKQPLWKLLFHIFQASATPQNCPVLCDSATHDSGSPHKKCLWNQIFLTPVPVWIITGLLPRFSTSCMARSILLAKFRYWIGFKTKSSAPTSYPLIA